MKRLLRSVIDVKGGVSQEHLIANFQRLNSAKIEWDLPSDKLIFEFIKSYFQDRIELPAIQTVTDFFSNSTEEIERLKDIVAAECYVRTNFLHLLKNLIEKQSNIRGLQLLKESEVILTKGLVIQEGKEKVKKFGLRDGLIHFTQKANELIMPEHNARMHGDIRQDGQEVWDEYQTAKVNKDKAWGKFTGLNHIDINCHGLKRGEMHVHAAFAGHLKTTMSTNWCYNLVTRYRTNVFYGSFEMKYEHIRRLIYVLHSANNRWKGLEPAKHQCPACPHPALDYRKVRDGELTPEEEVFYQLVIDDFEHNPEYCHFQIWCPDRDITIDDVRLETEMLHKQMELGFVVLDHGLLMKAREKNSNYGVELNSVLRDTKKYALHFNHGEGVPVLMLFQTNRDGLTEADKNDGVYKMKALSWASEAERSADVVTTTYLDDQLPGGGTYRKNNQTKICNLKNRDNPLFEPFMATVQFKTRRIMNLDITEHTGANMSVEDHQMMNALMSQV